MERQCVAYEVDEINKLLSEINSNDAISPRGIAQITFYSALVNFLRKGTMVSVNFPDENTEETENSNADSSENTKENPKQNETVVYDSN